MIDRRSVSLAGGIGLLVAHRLGHGQPAGAMRRVGILHQVSETAGAGMRVPFKQGMHDLGWLEGKNVEYETVSADGDVNRLDALARDLVEHVIVAGSASATRAAQQATKTIPIVMTGTGDPVLQGFVASLARPGGNITGISNQANVADPMYNSERVKLQELLHATRLPVAYGQPEHLVAGGLLSYTSNYGANFRYAAKFVDKILKGAKPADLPVEQPTRFDLTLNLKTAKALGITIPYSVMLRATEVVE
jgi:ABC-type uncharacterized transport system substrate-binding protein